MSLKTNDMIRILHLSISHINAKSYFFDKSITVKGACDISPYLLASAAANWLQQCNVIIVLELLIHLPDKKYRVRFIDR